jgi:hypothetical protein
MMVKKYLLFHKEKLIKGPELKFEYVFFSVHFIATELAKTPSDFGIILPICHCFWYSLAMGIFYWENKYRPYEEFPKILVGAFIVNIYNYRIPYFNFKEVLMV